MNPDDLTVNLTTYDYRFRTYLADVVSTDNLTWQQMMIPHAVGGAVTTANTIPPSFPGIFQIKVDADAIGAIDKDAALQDEPPLRRAIALRGIPLGG